MSGESTRCEECEDSPEATWTCVECECHLCDECHTHHKRSKRTSTHITRPLEATPLAAAVVKAPVPRDASPGPILSAGEASIHSRASTDVQKSPVPGSGVDEGRLITDSRASALSHTESEACSAISPCGQVMHIEAVGCQPLETSPNSSTSSTNNNAERTGMMLWKINLTRARAPWLQPETPKKKSNFAKLLSPNKSSESKAPGWLGVDMRNRADGHIIITALNPQGPAANHAAAIKVGDVLVSVGGTPVRHMTPEQLGEVSRGYAGTAVELMLGMQVILGRAFVASHRLATGEIVPVERVLPTDHGAPAENAGPALPATLSATSPKETAVELSSSARPVAFASNLSLFLPDSQVFSVTSLNVVSDNDRVVFKEHKSHRSVTIKPSLVTTGLGLGQSSPNKFHSGSSCTTPSSDAETERSSSVDDRHGVQSKRNRHEADSPIAMA